MPLILRVDVDKPYGHSSLLKAVKSKLSEDYWFPKFYPFNYGYLSNLSPFLEHCNREQIRGYFFFRHCTVPNKQIEKLMKEGRHCAGMHAENTRSFESFSAEYNLLQKRCELPLNSFTKHGSGQLKLGKNHYSPYEPKKYKQWASKLGIDYMFGNGICEEFSDFPEGREYVENMFWVEAEYRHEHFSDLNQLIECAKEKIVPVLIHPSNYCTNPKVKADFTELIDLAKKNRVEWMV